MKNEVISTIQTVYELKERTQKIFEKYIPEIKDDAYDSVLDITIRDERVGLAFSMSADIYLAVITLRLISDEISKLYPSWVLSITLDANDEDTTTICIEFIVLGD